MSSKGGDEASAAAAFAAAPSSAAASKTLIGKPTYISIVERSRQKAFSRGRVMLCTKCTSIGTTDKVTGTQRGDREVASRAGNQRSAIASSSDRIDQVPA